MSGAVPFWVFLISIFIALFIGGTVMTMWSGRDSRSAHSFYDPAVSVSATIERVTTEKPKEGPWMAESVTRTERVAERLPRHALRD